MTEFLSFNLNVAYAAIKNAAEAEPVTTKEAWDSYVEEYVNERVNWGELDPDQDTEQIIADLKAKWADYKENLDID